MNLQASLPSDHWSAAGERWDRLSADAKQLHRHTQLYIWVLETMQEINKGQRRWQAGMALHDAIEISCWCWPWVSAQWNDCGAYNYIDLVLLNFAKEAGYMISWWRTLCTQDNTCLEQVHGTWHYYVSQSCTRCLETRLKQQCRLWLLPVHGWCSL